MCEDANKVVHEDRCLDYGNEAVDNGSASLADFSATGSGHETPPPKIRSQPSRNATLAVTTVKLGRSYFTKNPATC